MASCRNITDHRLSKRIRRDATEGMISTVVPKSQKNALTDGDNEVEEEEAEENPDVSPASRKFDIER